MTIVARQTPGWAARHWFWLMTPALFVLSYVFATNAAQNRDLVTIAVILDWCIFVPSLYGIYLYRTLPFRAVALRISGASCAGLWIAGLILPADSEGLFARWGWVRYAETGVVLLLEGGLFVAFVRLLLKKGSTAADMERVGVPPAVARIADLERRFWRAVWNLVRGRRR